MFSSTEWELIESINNEGGNSPLGGDDIVMANVKAPDCDTELSIIKRFDFESKLQRMSVIVKDN